jgi:large subunit ribosomal protein L24
MSHTLLRPKTKFHIKRNDEVEVMSGSNRGKKGKVLQILTKNNRVIVEGVNLIKRATRPTQANPKGGFIEKEGSIHISNVRAVAKKEAKPAAKKKKSE